ncbi:MAG: phosphopentomutase, partial [Clostridia bacterium]|nr:phosphopentomutase [Clostridia bacterium]
MRAAVIVLDSVGVGALPDAAAYGDAGTNTLANVARAVGGLSLPHLERLGLGNILSLAGVPPCRRPLAFYGKMAEASAGKDTTTGHWELMGLVLREPFPTYPAGFPPEVINAFQAAIGRPVLGNKPASGTEIIAE